MTTAPPALPGRAWNKRLKESHELTRLLLVRADIRVVEDEPTVRVLAESIIAALGYMILSAANAREAIALLEQDEPIDILFTDINLPDGPDAIG
jgi:response regulator RpfG family c-di-GMP phosphodiesterase